MKPKLVFGALLTITIVVYSIFTLMEKKSNIDILLYIPHNDSYKSNCEAFNKNYTQFSIQLDNIIYPTYVTSYHNKSLNFECLNKNTNSKLILFWNQFFDDPEFGFGSGYSKPFKNHNCPVTNCEITTDRRRLKESNIIVFHMQNRIDRYPEYRHPDQEWVFFLYESPKHSNSFIELNGIFNTSATYLLKSDYTSIYYSSFEWGYNSFYDENKDFSSNKSGFAAAIISNCDDNSRRLDYIKELQKYISVHIYGKCGKPCPVENCREFISKRYKFLLAFENSVCKDYITEKFFNTLQYDIIPVVYGGGSYEKHVPPSGFINELKYDSLEDLANYLKYVDSNKTAYNSYFKWKKYLLYDQKATSRGVFCEMCIKLNLNFYLGIKRTVIRDFEEFWNDDKSCYPVLI